MFKYAHSGSYESDATYPASLQPASWLFRPASYLRTSDKTDWWIFLVFVKLNARLFLGTDGYIVELKNRIHALASSLSQPLHDDLWGFKQIMTEIVLSPDTPLPGLERWFERFIDEIDPKGTLAGVTEAVKQIDLSLNHKWVLEQKSALEEVCRICLTALEQDDPKEKKS